MKRTQPEAPFIRRHAAKAVTAVALGAIAYTVANPGDVDVGTYPRQPEYSCTDNPRGYVLQRLGKESVTAVLGVRQDNDSQPIMDNLVTITGNKKEATVMLPNGSRLVYPEMLGADTSVELSDPASASVRMAYVDGEPAIGIACSSEAWDGTVFNIDTDYVPLKQTNN